MTETPLGQELMTSEMVRPGTLALVNLVDDWAATVAARIRGKAKA